MTSVARHVFKLPVDFANPEFSNNTRHQNARRFGIEPGAGQEAGDKRCAGQRTRGENQVQGCECVYGIPRVFEEGNQILRGHVQEVSD